MQVKDLITFYINESLNTLDVTFRLETDNEDEIRNDSISLDEIDNYGYEFLAMNETDLFDDEEDIFESMNDNFFESSISEDEVVSFLNEYYIINPKKLPPVELF